MPAGEIEIRAAEVVPNKTHVLIYMPKSNKKLLSGPSECGTAVSQTTVSLEISKINRGGSHSSEGSIAFIKTPLPQQKSSSSLEKSRKIFLVHGKVSYCKTIFKTLILIALILTILRTTLIKTWASYYKLVDSWLHCV